LHKKLKELMKKLTIGEKITTYNEESFRSYMKEINEFPLMTSEEEFKVASEARKGNKEALAYLINSNLRFVISVAKQYVDKNHPIEDLVNEGNIGLIIAAQRFEPNKGFKFISYAVWWIRRYIQEYKNGTGEFIRKPSNKLNALNKFKDVKNSLHATLEREPTIEEVLEVLNDKKILNIVAEIEHQEVCSLDREINEDEFSLLDNIPSSEKTDAKYDELYTQHKITTLLSKLKPKELKVIEMSYGLKGDPPMTLQEIGNIMGLTREAVRQIKNKALFSLKIYANQLGISFDDFYNV